MKRGALNFLGRKNPSLFDSKIKINDTENMEWMLDSPAIPESGTASVRARPTVKHHASTDSFQGFAVPTPKVPLLPPFNGPKANGSVAGERLSNGSVMSVPDAVEGEIFVPPPPSVAPPPPPGAFVPPPPDFMGDLNTLGLATLQPPAQNLPPQAHGGPRTMEDDFVFLKPPPMAPPKPPSTCSTGSASSIPMCAPPPPAKVPEPPQFSPPQPPTEKQLGAPPLKLPPAKPMRMSSISNLDLPPHNPAPPPPVQTPTLSTFNPQNKAKLYSVPKTSVLIGHEIHEARPKQMLLLEDTGSLNSAPVLVQVDGRAPNVVTPTKPGVSRVAPEIKDDVQITQPSRRSQLEPDMEALKVAVSAPPEVSKPLPAPPQKSPQFQKVTSSQILQSPKPGKDGREPPASQKRFSPLIDRKLRNLKGSETSGAREGPATSPLALLKAAKEREKHRSAHSLSRQNSSERNQQPSASGYQSDLTPSTFAVAPRSSSSSSLTSQEDSATPEKHSSPSPIRHPMQSVSPAPSRTAPAPNPVGQNHYARPSPPKTQAAQQPGGTREESSMPLLPPPPEFGDFEDFTGPPPSIRPPDPPVKKPPTVSLPPPAPAPPPSHPKPKPPAALKLPPPVADAKPKPQIQTKAQMPPSQLPSPLSPNQATLLSILQKKMLEMDHKMSAETEADSTSDDWGDNKIPAAPTAAPPKSNYPAVKKAATLDMKELQGKVAKKIRDTSSTKLPTSNGPSKHQYGMSFTVRPGTKHPITPVSKGES